MTNHPITPPPELVSKWCYEDGEEIKSSPRWFVSVCAKAAEWGADQELEACCHCFARDLRESLALELRARRRPKPPSLRQRALEALELVESDLGVGEETDTIRRALEQLSE